MNATLLKRLFSAIHAGNNGNVDALCRKVIDEERQRGHTQVAEDLERILSKREKQNGPIVSPAGGLSPLPVSKRDSAPLIHVIPHDELRHHMVLADMVEDRFTKIEAEFAAQHRLAAHGLQPSRRILFYGPPGCGKTLGAERLAWATGLPLHRVRFDTLLSSFFGETLSNLRRVFDQISINPCALFLDECDTLARSRTERNDVGEINRITNALLELLDNYRGRGLIIAATNLDSALDSALFRRFDEVIKIPLPSCEEIARLLKVTLSAIRLEKGIEWLASARQLDGMSSSEVVQIAQNAAKRCVMQGGKTVKKAHLARAIDEYSARATDS
jgi:SpoVK/Ycf46/Vps4 family AAA+-type ATPase